MWAPLIGGVAGSAVGTAATIGGAAIGGLIGNELGKRRTERVRSGKISELRIISLSTRSAGLQTAGCRTDISSNGGHVVDLAGAARLVRNTA